MTPIHRRSFLKLSAGAAGLALTGAPALAQQAPLPAGTIRLVVPFSGGSMTDILARAIAERLSTRWNQQVIVENRPGIAGTSSVAKGAADGSQWLLTSNGHAVIAAASPNANFDPIRDFSGVTTVAVTPSILVVPENFPAATLAEFTARLKAEPGKHSYSSAGRGSSTGIAAELFRARTATQMTLVPFRGMPESQQAVLRGDTAMCFTFFNVGGDLIQSGKLKALAVTGERRLAQLPNVPTFAEAGLPEFRYDAWFGILAPAGLPRPLVARGSADIAEALKAPELVARFAQVGVELRASTPDAFNAAIAADAAAYGPLVAAAAG